MNYFMSHILTIQIVYIKHVLKKPHVVCNFHNFYKFCKYLNLKCTRKKVFKVFTCTLYLTDIKTVYLGIYFNSLYYIFNPANNIFIGIYKINNK